LPNDGLSHHNLCGKIRWKEEEAVNKNMAINILHFSNAEDFAGFVVQEIVEAKKTILSHTQELNDASRRLDNLSIGDGKKKPKWFGANLQERTRQREIEGFKILVNPTPDYELSILDEAIKAAQDRLEAFERLEKHLLPSLKDHTKITVISEDGIPIGFMYKEDL
jgi:hypothetical protein